MALKYTKPNARLETELLSVAQDAQSVIKSLEEQNYIPPEFPTATLIDICETLIGLPLGTAEGCRVPLEYARGRLPAIRRNHFALDGDHVATSGDMQEPQLFRGMSLDRTLSSLIASISTALDEYRFQASEQQEEPLDRLAEVAAPNTAEIAKVVAGADQIEATIQEAAAELSEIARPGSVPIDTLSRTLRDTEGLARVSKAELNFGTVVLRWYKGIVQSAKKMPKLIVSAAKAVKVGTDIASSFSGRWLEMCENLIDFGLTEVDKWADTAIEVASKLQSRIDGQQNTQASEPYSEPQVPPGEFDSGSLYRDGYVSYIEKRGLYGFLVDSEDTRYFLPLIHGHLRTGQAANLGAVARFRYSVNQRGRTAIEVSFVENSVFSTEHGVIRLSSPDFDFSREIAVIAADQARRGRVSVHKLRSFVETVFKSPLPLEEMLGYATFRDLLDTCPNLSVTGEEPNQWVEIGSPITEPGKPALTLASFEAWLLSILSNGSHPDGILLSQLGVMARSQFDVDGRIPAALGHQTYIQVLNTLETVRVVGSKGGAERVVLTTFANDNGLRLLDSRSNSEADHVLTEASFSNWLSEQLTRPENSNGILLSRVGFDAQNFFSTSEKIPQVLGYKNYTGLILGDGRFVILDSPPRQRVALTGSN